MAERLVCNQEVVGSNPIVSTNVAPGVDGQGSHGRSNCWARRKPFPDQAETSETEVTATRKRRGDQEDL